MYAAFPLWELKAIPFSGNTRHTPVKIMFLSFSKVGFGKTPNPSFQRTPRKKRAKPLNSNVRRHDFLYPISQTASAHVQISMVKVI